MPGLPDKANETPALEESAETCATADEAHGPSLGVYTLLASAHPFGSRSLQQSREKARKQQFTCSATDDDRGRVMSWHLQQNPEPVRYVRVQMHGRGTLALTQVEVFALRDEVHSDVQGQQQSLEEWPLQAFHRLNSVFSYQANNQVVTLINRFSLEANVSPCDLPYDAIKFSAKDLIACKSICDIHPPLTSRHLQLRVLVLQKFNQNVSAVLPLIDCRSSLIDCHHAVVTVVVAIDFH
jgi:hypothetical protein